MELMLLLALSAVVGDAAPPFSLGDASCWGAATGGETQETSLNFILCCNTRHFGLGGNPACWREGRSFQRCCKTLGDEPGLEDFVNRTVFAAAASFEETVRSLAVFMHRVDLERHAMGHRILRQPEAELLLALGETLRHWRSEHLQELANRLEDVLSAQRAARRKEPTSSNGLRIAILMGCTPDSATGELCQLGANLWQCYAQQHGYHFIFDSNPFPAHPRKFRFLGGSPKGLSRALDADFEEDAVNFLLAEPYALELGSDGATFKWWQRWYAARRHLPVFDVILVVDPDTAVFPSCMGTELTVALELPPISNAEELPGVITRDPRDGEDLNGGVFALTGSPWGLLFLDLLLARSRWPIDVAGGGGWCHARQAAEYETLLEVIALSKMASDPGSQLDYTSECMLHAVPKVNPSSDGGLVAGCNWPHYLACWRKNVRRLLGPPGQRSAVVSHVRLVDPLRVDLNYRPWSNEPRYRNEYSNSSEVVPVANAAFLWHYVGIPGKVASLLSDFRIGSLEDTMDCVRLQHLVQKADDLPRCGLGGSPVPCPFDDSLLMPRIFGC